MSDTTTPETPAVEPTPATETSTTAPASPSPENVVLFPQASETSHTANAPEASLATEPNPQAVSTGASATPAVEQGEEPRPLLVSRLIHVIGQFLSEYVDKPAHEMSEEMKHLFALFSQHLMLVNSINADEALAQKVIEAVDKEIAKVTEEFGGERKADPVASDPSNIVVPNIH